jgi:hypothetical protein
VAGQAGPIKVETIMPDPVSVSRSLDILGTKPVAEAVQTLTKGAVDAAEALLSRICLPAAEELGSLLRDKVTGWRARNFISMMQKLEKRMGELNLPPTAHAHPRIVHTIMEQASYADDTEVQEMWAGLLASSCTQAGDDDSNLIFTNLLGSLTRLQAKVLRYACEQCGKEVAPGALIQANHLTVPFEKLCEIANEQDVQRLDRELDSLRGMGLTEGGLKPGHRADVLLTPTALALHMYVRCQGSRASPAEFFQLASPTAPGGDAASAPPIPTAP